MPQKRLGLADKRLKRARVLGRVAQIVRNQRGNLDRVGVRSEVHDCQSASGGGGREEWNAMTELKALIHSCSKAAAVPGQLPWLFTT